MHGHVCVIKYSIENLSSSERPIERTRLNNHAQISRGYAQTNDVTAKLKAGYNDEIVILPVAKFHEENCKTAPALRCASHNMRWLRKRRLFPASFSFN